MTVDVVHLPVKEVLVESFCLTHLTYTPLELVLMEPVVADPVHSFFITLPDSVPSRISR